MSRPSVFRKIASWLKNTALLSEKCHQQEALRRVHRRYSVQTLEDRQMLDAAFSFIFDSTPADPFDPNHQLTIDNFSELVEEGLTISETASDYRFVLSEGLWTGVDNPAKGVIGNGTNDLRVPKIIPAMPDPIADAPLTSINIDDNLGLDIELRGPVIGTLDFSPVENFSVNSNRGNISQSPLSTVLFAGFNLNGIDDVTLDEIENEFGLITILDTNVVKIRDKFGMNLNRIDVNTYAEFESNGVMILENRFTVDGDVLLNANNGDIFQRSAGAVYVGGETFLKSNETGPFGINFGFGDFNGDGLNDNDFVGPVNVLEGSWIEIVDKNSLIVGDVNAKTSNPDPFIRQFYAEAQDGSVLIDGLVDVDLAGDPEPAKVILRATDGVTETPLGRIRTDHIILIGDGDFILDRDNEVSVIVGDVTGNLVFNNEQDLQVSNSSWVMLLDRDATSGDKTDPIPVNALEVRRMDDGSDGNLTITTSDDNVTQGSSASVIVESLTTIDVGTGNIIWEFGDELGDLLNDNDWNEVTVVNANNASFVDFNEMTILDINVDNDARFKAENEHALTADGVITVGNNLLFQSDIGLTQIGGYIDSAGLAVQGEGNFLFDLSNRIGDETTSGRIAAGLRSGELLVDNIYGLQVTTINAFGENIVGIDGLNLEKTWLIGSSIDIDAVVNVVDLLLESETTINQTTAITADSMIVRSNEDTNLTATNSVGSFAAEVEGNLDYNSGIEFSIRNITYGPVQVAGISVENGSTNNLSITTSDFDVHQDADAPVVVEGTTTISIGLGCLDFAFGDGNSDTVNDNDFNVVVVNSAQRIELVDRNDLTTNAIAVSDQIRLQSETGTIQLEGDLAATSKVLLQAGNGVQQNPDGAGVEGVIDTAALMIEGTGAFILDHPNDIGDATTPGEIAVDINGSLEINNQFALVSKTLTFDLKDGSTVTLNGLIIHPGGDVLVLNVSGLTIETEIAAPKIIINTTGDIIQGLAGRFITDALVLTGVGNFALTASNQIGTAGTPGLVAINVEGDVEIINDFALDFGLIVCGSDEFQGATLVPGVLADGDLTLRTSNEDITQSGDSVFTVPGEMTFDTGTGNVNLPGFLADKNNFNIVLIDSANNAEIVDVDSISVGLSQIANNFMVVSGGIVPGKITLDDNVVVGNQLMLNASQGVEQPRGTVAVDTLFLKGSNDFDLFLENEISNLGADITGNLNLKNEIDLTVVKDDYTDLNSNVTSFVGVDLSSIFLDGNFNLQTSDDDFKQASDAHVKVADTASFDLGTGNLDLSFGDSNTDTLNDNDLNVLAIAAATNADVTDMNSIGIDNVNVDNNLYIQSEGGSVSLQGIVSADNSIMLLAQTGAGTRSGALLETDTLLIEGTGEFSLDGANRIGEAVSPGKLGIDVDGNVIIHNDFGFHFDNVSFTQQNGTLHNIAGVDVDSGALDGNLFIKTSGPITDDDSIDVMVEGSAAFAADQSSDIDLGGASTVMASSIGLAGQNVTLDINNELVLDGVVVSGNLTVESLGDITQSGLDVSAMVGSRFVNVDGIANFIVDSSVTEQLGVNLMSKGTSLMNNQFGDQVIIEGTSYLTTGMGELGSILFRNAIVDTAQFPTINRLSSDQLTSLAVWAPNSSLTVSDLGPGIDYDVINNLTLLAGVDSENGQLVGKRKVTDNSKTRLLVDEEGVSIQVGGNMFTNAANSLSLANHADDSIIVAGTLNLVNQGGSSENRIRIGVASGGTRGDDSGATVEASKLRARARRNGADGHVTVNLDSDVEFTNSSYGKSLVVVSGGNITDDATASISVASSALFDANGGAGDITLGDQNSSNRTIFGTVSFLGNNVDFTEDNSTRINGSVIGGNLEMFVDGSIRQTGSGSSTRVGTNAVEVTGDTTITLDGDTLPTDELRDFSGRDVLFLCDGAKSLLDNQFAGSITIQSTQNLSGGLGTVRNVKIRNVHSNASTPVINVNASDQIKNLTLWHTDSSVDLDSPIIVAGDLMLVAGLDTVDGKFNGEKFIVNDTVVRDISDQNSVVITVARNASFFAANHINLVNDATNSLLVGRKATFVSLGGNQGNQVDVGTAGPRGTDSGGTFTTKRLNFTIDDTGVGGDLTIVADQTFVVDAESSAPSVFLSPTP